MSTTARPRRRYGDNDRNFGPFLFSTHLTYRPFAVAVSSGKEDDDGDEEGCNMRLSAFGRTLIIELPNFIKPHRTMVFPASWDAATIERLGRNYYFDVDAKVYGFSVSDGFLQVFLGRQTHNSSTDRQWSKFLPWTQWRFVRRSLYGINGEHFWTEPKGARWNLLSETRDRCPSASFEFLDFDGEKLVAKTQIEELEWKFGEGWFKWLSAFRKNKVRRSLDLNFSGETGKRKGSWKGGTIGHSIDMRPGELHASAFQRYCVEHNMTFIGRAGEAA